MLAKMPRKPTITLAGAGRLAQTLGRALKSAGYRVEAVVGRDLPESRQRANRLARAVGARAAVFGQPVASDLLWICVSDDAIARVAQAMAPAWRGKVALHSSGALTSEALRTLRRGGAATASAHPMMTFVRGAKTPLNGVSFALEGDAAAVRMARRMVTDLGGRPFVIAATAKPLYHAMGSFASPLSIATLAVAEQVGRAAGVPGAAKAMRPLVRRTIENYFAAGAAEAFSGPIRRADLETVRKHLAALKKVPAARAAYVALAKASLTYLPVRDRKALRRLLHDASD